MSNIERALALSLFAKANIKLGNDEKRDGEQDEKEVDHGVVCLAPPIPVAQFLSARRALALMFRWVEVKPQQTSPSGGDGRQILKTLHCFSG